jgi:hypothetical protein
MEFQIKEYPAAKGGNLADSLRPRRRKEIAAYLKKGSQVGEFPCNGEGVAEAAIV